MHVWVTQTRKPMDLPPFAVRLRSLRAQGNLNQQQVAAVAKVAQTTISSWESGASSPGAEELARLARFFGCTTDFLCGVSASQTPLPQGSWLIDQDLVEQLRTNTVPDDVDLRVEGWYVAIPARPRIVTSAEFQAMLAELGPKIEKVLQHRRRRKP